MDPHEYCRQKAAASGSSFYYSIRSLSPDRRRAMTALHAFRREVADIAVEVRDAGVARTKLVWWRDEIDRLYAGTPRHPVARALAGVAGPFGLERGDLEEIIQGAAMDLEYNAYPDFEALKVYCHRAGSIPRRLSAKILGYRDARTIEHADALGVAFQLSDIIRSVGEDARRGRVYLPLHELAEYGVTSDDLLHARETDNFRRLMTFQIARANGQYDRALALLPAVDRPSQRQGLVMAAICRTLLREIEADGCHVLTHRIALTPLRKLWIAWRAR